MRPGPTVHLSVVDVPLERDRFLGDLLRHLAGTLEEVVGLPEADGFISVVGQRMGQDIDQTYRRALQVDRLSREQVSAVLVDLKRRIEGDFYVVEETADRIVLGNRACPLGDAIMNRPSLCMMTSNVFGAVAADNLGYAKVSIERAIARGDAECRVIVYLKADAASAAASGREYVGR